MNAKNNSLLQQIPQVDSLLNHFVDTTPWTRSFLRYEIRLYLEQLRQKVIAGQNVPEIQGDKICQQSLRLQLAQHLQPKIHPEICRTINATGIILHTGLGRAVLPAAAIATIQQNLRGYSIVEVDRDSGKRTRRDQIFIDQLCFLTGAEDATVVNNNAGAVLLTLSALAKGKEVIVSRGQLVEIGGSFRVPEIMEQSGAKLVEIGCTNRIYLADYEKAITSNTAAILHVHPANFKISGFTNSVSLEQLAKLALARDVKLIEDAGSGAVIDFSSWGLQDDPVISQSINAGADVVTFSGDKMLGACQAGIIVGKHPIIEKIRKHPLARALRVDKITLAILESTLKLYQQKDFLQQIPVLAMVTAAPEQIKLRAEKLAENLRQTLTNCQIAVTPSVALAGSGSFPTQAIASYAVLLKQANVSASHLAKSLRQHCPPVFVRIQDEHLAIDLRTISREEDAEIVEIVKKIMTGHNHIN